MGIQRLFHWGPILALTVIAEITIASVICILQWWPVWSLGGAVHFAIFLTWDFLILYNFFQAAFIGPGYVPFGWRPKEENDSKKLQFCDFCRGYKVPRSHHCRKCSRCVMKMDHHCPWINNCVGHRNHANFTYFLLFAPLGCIHAATCLISSMYRAINREPIVHLGVYSFVACMFAVGLAVGVIVAVGGLLFIQVRTILRNETGIESWIIEKARYREEEEEEEEGVEPGEKFVFPYNLSRKDNWWMVFHQAQRKELDGIYWPVREGANQFTLTLEQIKQKKEKKERSVVYEVRETYSGAVIPCTHGCKVCCCPPCTDEPRIALFPGEKVLVSRWKKHWLYGDKILDRNMGDKVIRVRGWFPRRCCVEIVANEPVIQEPDTNNANLSQPEKKKNK